MSDWIRLVGPNRAVEIFGVKLVGVTAATGRKVLLSIVLVAAAFAVRWLLRQLGVGVFRRFLPPRVIFWYRQAVSLAIGAVLTVALLSTWFDDPARLATALGLVTAGLAFALQKVISALAGYVVILRGKTFQVGDRITMGGVRGDVVGLSFMQTTIMEMGQPPPVQQAEPPMWVRSRQYTGRLVTVSNAKVFEEPVYNYTREFPYIWEELSVPVRYGADRGRAESILRAAAERHSVDVETLSTEALAELERRYFLRRSALHPRVYLRLTDNWLELTVRFVVAQEGIRETKDAISRDVVDEFERAGIEVASATIELAHVPALRIAEAEARAADADGGGLPVEGRH